jgi:hypothetical protein
MEGTRCHATTVCHASGSLRGQGLRPDSTIQVDPLALHDSSSLASTLLPQPVDSQPLRRSNRHRRLSFKIREASGDSVVAPLPTFTLDIARPQIPLHSALGTPATAQQSHVNTHSPETREPFNNPTAISPASLIRARSIPASAGQSHSHSPLSQSHSYSLRLLFPSRLWAKGVTIVVHSAIYIYSVLVM